MAKLTIEDIQRTRKQLVEADQRQHEILAKQTNPAPIYNKVPTLEQHYQNKVAQNAQIDTRNVDRAQEAAIKKAARDLQQIQDARRAQERADEYNNHMESVRNRRANTELLPSERTPRPTTKYRDEIAGQTNGRKRTPYDTEFNDFYEWRFNRADTTDYDPQTDTNIPHWEQVKEDIKKKHNWSEDQFNKYWEQYNNARNQEMADNEVATAVKIAENNRLAGNLLRQVYAPQQMIEGGMTALEGLTGMFAPNSLPTSASDPRFTGTRVREATNQAIRDQYKTGFGRGAHDFITSLEDMGMNVAFGGGGAVGMGITSGLQSATRNQMTALERGADANKAALFGTMGGAVSGVLNSIGLDGVLGAEAKTALRTVAKAAVREGAENVSEDMLTLAWDQIINQNASQLQTLHDYYVANGDDDKTAWKKVIGDTARDLGISALSGAAFGGLMSGGRNLPALTKELGDAAQKLPFVNAKGKQNTDIESPIVNNIEESVAPEIKAEQEIEGKQPKKEIPAVKQAPKAEEQELPWNESAQPGTIENYRNNRAQMIEAARVEAEKNNQWEYQRIIDTVNRMDADTQKLHPDWFDEHGEVKQAEAPVEETPQRTYESDVADWEALENKYDNLKQYSNEPVKVTKQELPQDLVDYAVDENYDNAPESTKIGTELARRGYNVMENGGNNNLMRDEWSILNDAVAHHLAEENIPASIMAEAYDTVYQQGGTLNDAIRLAAEMAGTRLNEGDANVGSSIRLGETSAESAPKSQIPTVAEPQSAILDNDLVAKRAELVDRINTESLKIDETAKILRQIKAIENELAETRPDLFQDGKYVGENKQARYDFSGDDEGEVRASDTEEAPASTANNLAERYASVYDTIDTYDYMDNVGEIDTFVNQMTEDIESGKDLTSYIERLEENIDEAPDDETVAEMQSLIDELNELNADRVSDTDARNEQIARNEDRIQQIKEGAERRNMDLNEYENAEIDRLENETADLENGEAPKTEAPAKATPEEKAETRKKVSDTYQRMRSKIDDKSLRNIKFDNPSDKATFDNARKDFYSSLHKLSEVMETTEDVNEILSAISDVEKTYRAADAAIKKGYINNNSWKQSIKEVKQNFAEGTRGMVIKLPDDVKNDTSLRDSTLREINGHMSTLGGNNYLKFSKNGGTPIDMVWDELVAASGNELKASTDTNSDYVQALYDYVGKFRGDVAPDKITMDEGIQGDDFWDELSAATSEAGNRLKLNLQTFAKAKGALEERLNENLSPEEAAKIKEQIATIDKLSRAMKGKYLFNEDNYGSTEKSSKSVTNTMQRIDANYAQELKEAGIDRIWTDTHKKSFSEATELVQKDPEGALEKYMNNQGGEYNATDYNAIRILENRLKKQRAQAKLEGDTELEAKLTEQLHKLSNTMTIRSHSSGSFIEAAKMWINTYEGAVAVARNRMAQAIDNMPDADKKVFNDAAQEIEDYADELLDSRDLWQVLKDAERRENFESQLIKKIIDIGNKKNIKVNEKIAKKIAFEVAEGARMDTIARDLAAFHEYDFLDIDEGVLTEVEDMMDRASRMRPGSKERDQIETAAFKKLADELYKNGSDWGDRWDAWRYFAMLSKGATDIRNVGSTAIFSGLYDRIANTVAAAIEAPTDAAVKGAKWVLNKTAGTNYDTSKGIKRTKTLATLDPSMIKKSGQDVNKNAYTRLKGHKYAYNVDSGIEANKPIHRPGSLAHKTLDRLYDLRGDILSAEDMFFKRNKYATSLTGWLKANKIDESIFDAEDRYYELREKAELEDLTASEKAEFKEAEKAHNTLEEGREYAIKQARYSTYNAKSNAGKITQATKLWRQSRNPAVRMFGRWVEGMMAFKQVPVNIFKTIYHFSPLSAPQSIGKLAQSVVSADATRLGTIGTKNHNINIGQSTVSDAISMLSKTLTGTGLMALGAYMYDNGSLIPSPDENRKKSDEAEGKQSYSVKVGDHTYTVDWMGTGATPLLLGAEVKRIWNKYHKEDDTFWDTAKGITSMNADEAVNSVLTAFNPMIEMSFMKGAADTLESVRYSDSKAEGALAFGATPVMSYFGQGIPTPLGAATRTADNTRRTLRTNADGAVGVFERAARQQMNKVPGLVNKNMPYVDMYGRQENILNSDNLAARSAYNFLSPTYGKKINVEPFQAELDRLYEETGDPEVLGKSFPNKIDGERLTNEEYFNGQTVAGEAWTGFMNAALENEDYKNLPTNVQKEVQKAMFKAATNLGTAEVRPDKKINDELVSIYNNADPGTRMQDVVNGAIEQGQNTVRNAEIKDMGLPANEVTKAYYDEGNQEKLDKYKEALNIARKYGRTSISEKEWQTYDVKGKNFFETEIKYANQAKEAGVTDSENFRNAVRIGQEDSYVKAYNAITSTVTGQDDLGNEKHLEYNDTTRQIYDDKDQYGLDQYATLQKSLPKGFSQSSDSDVINAVRNSSMSQENEAYFFVLHKGDSIAQSAPQPTNGNYTDTYMWYLAKNHFDTDGKSGLSKDEKTALYRGVYDYLVSLGYTSDQAQKAQKWTYK